MIRKTKLIIDVIIFGIGAFGAGYEAARIRLNKNRIETLEIYIKDENGNYVKEEA